MYPPTKEWTRFANDEEKLEYFKKWGLASKKAKTIPPVIYCAAGVSVPTPCEVVGYQEHFCAVVEIKGELSCIHGSHLAETQPKFPRKSSNEKGTIQTSLDNNQELLDYAKILQDYIVLDIETTGLNKRTDRIIEIAAIHYSKGVVADTYHTLVNPEREVPSNIVALTGITQAEVDTAPVLADIADSFWQFVGDCPIVGHNIKSFDLPFLAIQLDAISENENGSWLLDSTPLYRRAFGLNRPIIDTLYLVRNRFPNLPGRKLEQLKQWLGINIAVSHRALADVETTNEVFLACYTPEKYAERLKQVVVLQKAESVQQKLEPTVSIDVNNPFYGKMVVFTGTLPFSREYGMLTATNAGAIVKTAVSGKTDYLIVGAQDKTIVGEDGMSTKEEKAYALIASGKGKVKIISGDEFLVLAGVLKNR